MLQSQKIISCLLSIAVIFGIMLTITCMAVENNPQEGEGTSSQSSEVEGTSPEEGNTEDGSTEDGNTEEEGNSGSDENESSEESSEDEGSEVDEESSEEEQDNDDKYYYSGDVSYPPYTGSRVLKNPNMVEEESKAEEKEDKPVEKNINDWSYVARRWVALPVIFTLLSLGGLIWFNLYAKKQNGKDDRRRARRRENAKEKSEAEKNSRNFERPKH